MFKLNQKGRNSAQEWVRFLFEENMIQRVNFKTFSVKGCGKPSLLGELFVEKTGR